ncbi:MAG: DHA2 family efflux MFS transporter permease subunit [Dehalococcoidales bacterium]|nr:DHA2 family efflux MFS transporter permease subunit [Dehalococcoidales bacterium]
MGDFFRNLVSARQWRRWLGRLVAALGTDRWAEGIHRSRRYKWWVLGVNQIAILMALLDASIVNIALPTILAELNTDLVLVEWVVTGYLLVITTTLLIFGRLGDMVGRKKVFTVGFLVFTLGSGLSGASANVWELIGFRLLQGVGAAMLLANNVAIITAVFPRQQRGLALGINGITAGVSVALGPTLGGFMVDYFGWGSIFFLNVPIGVIGSLAALLILDERTVSVGQQRGGQRFDLLGAGISIVALTALLIALNAGPEVGWTSFTVLALFVGFLVLMIVFVVVEARVEQPMVNLALFRRADFSAGLVAGLFGFMGIAANAFLMPFYLQLVLGYPAVVAGLLMSPTSFAALVVSPISGWTSDRIGYRLLTTVGIAIFAVALGLLSTLTVGTHYLYVLYWLLLLGFGWGLFLAPNNSSIMGTVPRDQLGMGSGLLALVRNLGLVVGVAVTNAFLLSSIASVSGQASLGALELSKVSGAEDRDLLLAFDRGLREAYLAAAIFAAIAVPVSFIRRGPLIPSAAQLQGRPGTAGSDPGESADSGRRR